MKYVVFAMLLLVLDSAAPARTPPRNQGSQTARAAFSPAKSIGMFAFPKNGQNSDQQLKDESQCYSAANQQTGIDPQAPAPAGKSAEQKRRSKRPPQPTLRRL
jgi:hypothetical protein